MKVAIHQPNYLPWPGYFKKMSICDVFVFLDDVQLNKEGYTRRVKIRHPEKLHHFSWLTVPLQDSHHDDRILDLDIDRKKNWISSHLGLIRHVYKNAPGWYQTGPWFEGILEKCMDYDKLADMNIFLVRELAAKMNIQCDFIRSSKIAVSGSADSYTYALVKELGGTTYIRGKGEQRYAKSPLWESDAELKLVNVDYIREVQNDPTGTWRNGYSVIDLFFMSTSKVTGYFG